jgi:hypothetical protein
MVLIPKIIQLTIPLFQDFDNISESGSSGSDTMVARQPRRPNMSIFLRPAYEDNQAIRQNPLYNDESAL